MEKCIAAYGPLQRQTALYSLGVHLFASADNLETMPRYQYREIEPTREAKEVFNRWIESLDDEFSRHQNIALRGEIVRDNLHQLMLGRPHGGRLNFTLTTELPFNVLQLSLDPANVTLEPFVVAWPAPDVKDEGLRTFRGCDGGYGFTSEFRTATVTDLPWSTVAVCGTATASGRLVATTSICTAPLAVAPWESFRFRLRTATSPSSFCGKSDSVWPDNDAPRLPGGGDAKESVTVPEPPGFVSLMYLLRLNVE